MLDDKRTSPSSSSRLLRLRARGVYVLHLVKGISERPEEREFSAACGCCLPILAFHAEQVVNNETSLMVSSVNAIWKRSRSVCREQRWMI